jgi:hypothetical protein
MFGDKEVRLKAVVLSTEGFRCNDIRVGDVVTLTRDDRHIDGSIATDMLGTFGESGFHYELLEEE